MRRFQSISFIIILSSFILSFETKAMEENTNESGQQRNISSKPAVEKSKKDKSDNESKEKPRKRNYTTKFKMSFSSQSEGSPKDADKTKKSSQIQGLSVEELKAIREKLCSNLEFSKKRKLLKELASYFGKGKAEDSERASLIFLESFDTKWNSHSCMDWIFCQDGEFCIQGNNGRMYTHHQQNQFWETLVKVIEAPDYAKNILNSVQPESWVSGNKDISYLQKKAKGMVMTLTYTVEELEEFWPEENYSSLFKLLRNRIKNNPQKQFSVDAAFNIYCNALLKQSPLYRPAVDWVETIYIKQEDGGVENCDGTRHFLTKLGFYLQNNKDEYWDKDHDLVNYVSEGMQQYYKESEGRFRLVAAAHAYRAFLKHSGLSDIAYWILPYMNPAKFTPEAKETIKLLKTIEKEEKKRSKQ